VVSRGLLIALIVAACVPVASASAASGDLDTSYGQGGAAIADFGTFGTVVDNASGNAVVVEPDGKAIVVGTGIDQFGRTSDVVTARFTTSGALDTSWGGTGKAQFDFGQSETGYGAVLQPDGKLIVGGDSTDTSGASTVLAIRIDTNGTSDSTFGSSGVARPAFGSNEFGRAILLQPNGAIVIGGYDAGGDSLVVRLNNSGTPDTSFNTTGYATQFFEGGSISGAAIALAADGSYDLAGTLTTNAQSYLSVSHVPANNASSEQGDIASATGAGTAIVDTANGFRLVAGYTNAHGTYDFTVDRYTFGSDNSFSLDPSFGTAGRTVVDLGGSDLDHAMVVQPDGKIVLAGTTTAGSGATATSKIGVVRLLANGQPDPSFGTNGVELVGISGAKLAGDAVALQSNGDIVVGGTITPAGSTRKQLLVIRLHGDATGSASTGGGSTTTTGGGGSTGGGAGTTGGGGGGAVSKTIPLLTSLTLTPFAFAAAPGGPTVIASPTSRKGTVIAYKLNVAATVSFVVEHSLPGRRQLVNGKQRCVAQTHKNAHAGACTRVVTVGRFTQAGTAGANSLRFSGRIDAEKLPRGSYAIIATPKTLVAGHAVSKTFKIKG
jgi:uncharacterized delta-60 repeat protein